MTNASAKNMFKVLSGVAVALALFVGAFAGTAHAQVWTDNGGYGGFGAVEDFGSSFYSPISEDFGSSFYSPSAAEDFGSSYYSPEDFGSSYYSPQDFGSSYYSQEDFGSSYYSPSSPSYSSSPTYGASYGSGPSYGASYGSSSGSAPYYTSSAAYAPIYSSSYIPQAAKSAIYSATTAYAPAQRAPTYTTSSGSSPVYNTSANYNTNVPTNTSTNTNTNTPTFYATYTPSNTSTNTNTPIATASIGHSGNSAINNSGNSSASTGAINNVFAPVVTIGSGGAHREADYNIPAPSCTIHASNAYSTGYGYNQPMTLSWSSQNATKGYISPNVGNVQPQGSVTVYPTGYTTYTLTVYGPGGSATCQTAASYATSYIAQNPIYTASPAPIAPYVSLSQIPYTGFDFGPFGNAMYWAVLFSVAAAAAYLFVYFLPGRRTFAFANVSGSKKNEAFTDKDLQTVFQSNFSPMVALEPETESVTALELPKMESNRLTTDSMIVDRSSGAPRIIIARN